MQRFTDKLKENNVQYSTVYLTMNSELMIYSYKVSIKDAETVGQIMAEMHQAMTEKIQIDVEFCENFTIRMMHGA